MGTKIIYESKILVLYEIQNVIVIYCIKLSKNITGDEFRIILPIALFIFLFIENEVL